MPVQSGAYCAYPKQACISRTLFGGCRAFAPSLSEKMTTTVLFSRTNAEQPGAALSRKKRATPPGRHTARLQYRQTPGRQIDESPDARLPASARHYADLP